MVHHYAYPMERRMEDCTRTEIPSQLQKLPFSLQEKKLQRKRLVHFPASMHKALSCNQSLKHYLHEGEVKKKFKVTNMPQKPPYIYVPTMVLCS